MKIILSRKGFDSATGGRPSPLFVDTGRLLSIPIPEENKLYKDDTGRRYSDLIFDKTRSYLDVMIELDLTGFENKSVHVDPDIDYDILSERKPGWKGMFGQCDAAQGHLIANNVEVGDLFLFYGWFKEVERQNGKFKYIPGTEKHIIWGYMQIGEIDSIDEFDQYEDWKLSHPHYVNRDRGSNTGYIARDYLDFCPDLPGCGVFNFNESLILTCPNSTRSVWKLPRFFHPSYGTEMTYHKDVERWTLRDDCCILDSAKIGQEFIISGNQDVIRWAKQIVINACSGSKEFTPMKNYNNTIVKTEKTNMEIQYNNPRYVTMLCTRRFNGEVLEVLYDLEDHEKVKQLHWKVEKNNKKVYAVLQGTQNIFLHRLVMGAGKGTIVKAKNGNYFDCRKQNLIVMGKNKSD
jgi:hypothetical protein